MDSDKPTLMVALLKEVQSDYKDLLIERIKAEYGTSYIIIVKTGKRMDDLKSDRYDYVIVMERNMAWRLKREDIQLICGTSNNANSDGIISQIMEFIPTK